MPEPHTNPSGLALIKAFESCLKPVRPGVYTTYRCPANVVTIGWGTTRDDVPTLREGDTWTRQRCDEVFADSLTRKYEPHVTAYLRDAAVNDNQFSTLVSWAYNTGGPASSAVWAAVRSGDHKRVPVLLGRWNKGGGKVLRGLVRRRQAEGLLYAGNVSAALEVAGTAVPGEMPQAKYQEPPKPTAPELAATAKKEAAAATGSGGGLWAMWDQLTAGQQTALVVVVVAVVAAAGWFAWRRIKYELENWA